MKKKYIFIAIAIITIINLSAFSTMTYYRYCQRQQSYAHKETCSMGNLFCQKLALSQNQIQQMQKMSIDFHSQADSVSQLLGQKRYTMVEILSNEPEDIPKLDMLLLEIDGLQSDLQKQVISYILKEKTILTTEQRNTFFEIIKKRMIREAHLSRSSNFNLIETNCDSTYMESNNCSINNN